MISTEDLAGAQEAIDCVGGPTIDPRILAIVLDANPELVGLAHSWTWTDTEVRDQVNGLVTRYLLDLDKATYLRRLRDEASLNADLMEANARWVTRANTGNG